jgi:5'-3' exonuclease
MPRVMIVDALNMFIRAYITNPTLSPNGQPVGGVVGTINILQKLCKQTQPDQIVICWDGENGSKKRKSMNSNYKEGRNPIRLNRDVRNLDENQELENKIWQQTRLAEYLNNFPIIQFMYPNIEADDLVSYTVNHSRYRDWQKVIVSSDKDFIQLINDKTILYRPIQEQILTTKKVLTEYGVHPNNFALARAVAGDASDNIKGVGGVGMKTLAKRVPLLQLSEFCTVDKLVDYCVEQDQKVKCFSTIASSREAISDNYRLMQLATPQISYQVKSHMNETLEDFKPEINQLEIRKMSIQDGFGTVDHSYLITMMKRFVANGTI